MMNITKYRAWSVAVYTVVFVIFTYVIGAGIFVYSYVLKFEKLFESRWVVYSSVPSPDNMFSAVIYEMQGDATVPFNTQLSIAPTDRPFSPKENPSFLALEGQHNLTVRWIDGKAIEVVGVPQDVKIYKEDPSVGGITVEYR